MPSTELLSSKSTPHTASYAITAAGLQRLANYSDNQAAVGNQCGVLGLSYGDISLTRLRPLASASYGRAFGHALWWRATRQWVGCNMGHREQPRSSVTKQKQSHVHPSLQ